ncbi:hypothetical protein JCM16138_09570 [Thermococcus atlanticus]
MLGLVLRARPLQVHFRIPYNSLLLESYPFPPKTTAVGMLAGAMGLPEEGFRKLLESLKYGVIIENPGMRVEEVAAIFKNPNSPLYPIKKVLIHGPAYKMFFSGPEEVIERAYEGLKDPEFTPYLGDSESLFYPPEREYARITDVESGMEEKLRSIVPWEIYRDSKRFVPLHRNILVPREYSVPVGFTYRGRNRRAIYRRVVAFANGYIELKKEAEVLLFDGEPVAVF